MGKTKCALQKIFIYFAMKNKKHCMDSNKTPRCIHKRRLILHRAALNRMYVVFENGYWHSQSFRIFHLFLLYATVRPYENRGMRSTHCRSSCSPNAPYDKQFLFMSFFFVVVFHLSFFSWLASLYGYSQ